MADYTNEDKKTESSQINTWIKRIESSKRLREQTSAEYAWEDVVKEFHGKYNIDAADIYIPILNLTFAYVQTEIPALSLRNPHIKVNPKNAKSVESAKIMEKAINYIWRHKRLKRENTKNILDGLLVGHSWFKSGYSGQFGVTEDSNGNRFEFIEKEDFFGYRIPWDCIYFNPDSLDPPYDCNWIAHETWATKENVESNSNYNPDVVKKLQYGVKKGDKSKKNYSDDEDTLQCCLYEVWDKSSGTKFTISPGTKEYLEAPKAWPYEMRGFPFSYLCFNPSPTCVYGIPDIYTFRPQVLELIKVYAMMLDHLKRFNRQLVVKGTPLTESQLTDLKQGITGMVLNGVPSDTTIEAVVYPPMQQDVYAIERLLKEMIIIISGQSAQEKGGSQVTTTRTVSELEMMKQGNVNRRSRKVDLVEDFIRDIAENLIALLQQFADVPYYVRLTGDEFGEIAAALTSRPSANNQEALTSPSGFTFTKEDIQGEFDLEIVPGSTTPLDRQATMQTLERLLPALKDLGVLPGGPVVGAIGNIYSQNLEMPEISKAIKEEAAMAAAMKEEQNAAMQEAKELNVVKESSKISVDASNAATKQNKVQAEFIKTMLQHQEAMEDKKEGEGD